MSTKTLEQKQKVTSADNDNGGNQSKVVKVGSRKSELALIQTKHVISILQKLFPNIKFEIHTMSTLGDRVLGTSLPKIGEKSLFTKDLEEALTYGGVDFVVHSLKDLPTQLPHGMTIGAILKRDDPRDALVLNSKFIGRKLKTLPEGSLIGTSSLRRSAQLSRNYMHLNVCDIRGNLNTRLAKLDAPQSKFCGILLANAGLVRMGWMKRVDQIIDPEEMLYAVGQGALAVECRVNDDFILDILSPLCDFQTQCRILTERSFLKTLGGGCSAPVAVNSVIEAVPNTVDNEFSLKVDGAVWSLDGKTEIVDHIKCTLVFDGDDVLPTKRPKLTQTDNGDKSPEIINDDPFELPHSSENDDKNVTEIMNVHGKLIADVCPYSSGQTSVKNYKPAPKRAAAGNFKASNIPVGQDFMGECPVLSTEQKISYDIEACADACGGCPNKKSGDIEQCPFMQKKPEAVRLIDYEEMNKNQVKEEQKSLIADVEDIKLYCGLFCHNEKLRKTFEKCENLGIDLANKLISVGALEVMKIAQDEIHSKV